MKAMTGGMGRKNQENIARLAAIGQRLRRIEAEFKNRSEAAAVAGVAKSTFQSWVFGQRDPSFVALVRLAEHTGYSLDWLATGEGPMRRQLQQEAHKEYWRERLAMALAKYRLAVSRLDGVSLPLELAMTLRDLLALGDLSEEALADAVRVFARERPGMSAGKDAPPSYNTLQAEGVLRHLREDSAAMSDGGAGSSAQPPAVQSHADQKAVHKRKGSRRP